MSINPYELVAAIATAQGRVDIEQMEINRMQAELNLGISRFNAHQGELSRLIRLAPEVAAAYPGQLVQLHPVPNHPGEYTTCTPEENHDLS